MKGCDCHCIPLLPWALAILTGVLSRLLAKEPPHRVRHTHMHMHTGAHLIQNRRQTSE